MSRSPDDARRRDHDTPGADVFDFVNLHYYFWQRIQRHLDAQVDALSSYDGYDLDDDPSGINIPEVLPFRRLLKCYDMRDFGRYLYDTCCSQITSGSGGSLRRKQAREGRSLALPSRHPVIEMPCGRRIESFLSKE